MELAVGPPGQEWLRHLTSGRGSAGLGRPSPGGPQPLPSAGRRPRPRQGPQQSKGTHRACVPAHPPGDAAGRGRGLSPCSSLGITGLSFLWNKIITTLTEDLSSLKATRKSAEKQKYIFI